MKQIEFEVTADGSHTLYVPAMDEHYHSVNGAIQESNHVFINAGLWQCTPKEIHIFEIGFGTGLNALLTYTANQELNKRIIYSSIEAYPLPTEITNKLNYAHEISENSVAVFDRLHAAKWNEAVEIDETFTLHKIEGDLTKLDTGLQPESINLFYFDAFAPDKQPDIWNQAIFDYIYKLAAPNAIFTTYCAKGVVRRMLQQAGFKVERLQGPPGKREMLRGVKCDTNS